jgi:hypothetical protein
MQIVLIARQQQRRARRSMRPRGRGTIDGENRKHGG